jgi:hypothetical protein
MADSGLRGLRGTAGCAGGLPPSRRRGGGRGLVDILDELEHMVASGELTPEQRRPLFWAIRTARELQHEDKCIEDFSHDFEEDEF